VGFKVRGKRTSFCEQKEAKKLYSSGLRIWPGHCHTHEPEEQKFFGSFFQKRTACLPPTIRNSFFEKINLKTRAPYSVQMMDDAGDYARGFWPAQMGHGGFARTGG